MAGKPLANWFAPGGRIRLSAITILAAITLIAIPVFEGLAGSGTSSALPLVDAAPRAPSALRSQRPALTTAISGAVSHGALAEQAELASSDEIASDGFGSSVSLSADGMTALVGAPSHSVSGGAAYVFQFANGSWTERHELTVSGLGNNDGFGTSVALSPDGLTALVGAPNQTVASHSGEGAAYLFSSATGVLLHELTPNSGTAGERFGSSVSISSTSAGGVPVAIIGAPGSTGQEGEVFVFSATTNQQLATQFPSNGGAGDQFGSSVAVSADGTTFVVGSPFHPSAGLAYIYGFSSPFNGTPSPVGTLTGFQQATNFGTSVAISSDGGVAVVGAPGGAAPNAFVFFRSGVGNGALTPSGELPLLGYGSSVALSPDGTTALIGDVPVSGSEGKGYLFSISQSQQMETGILVASNGRPGDLFGASVSLSVGASSALVGSPGIGNTHVFGPGSPTAPSAPQEVTATQSGPTAANVSWQAPSSNGGSLITGYMVTAHDITTATPGPSASEINTTASFSGLVAGNEYNFTVTAQNALGSSPIATSNDLMFPPVGGASGGGGGGGGAGGAGSGGAGQGGSGYDLVGSDGGVFVFAPPGSSGGYFGSLPGLNIHVNDVVGMVPTGNELGYFLVGADGGVFSFGDAPFLGSLPGLGVAVSDVVGIVPTASDQGYFLVGKDGGVFSFGNAPFLGSLPGLGISRSDIVGISATPSGDGYWLVAADGTVYSFGAAAQLGSVTGSPSQVVAISGTPGGSGYWITTQNGGVYAFGSAGFLGSLPALGVSPANSVIGLVPTEDDSGYWLIAADGGIFAFGDAGFIGSLPQLGVRVGDVVGAVPVASVA